MANNEREASRESYRTVWETCPHVDQAMERATEAIKVQTGALRDALTQAIESRMDLQDELDDANAEIARLRQEVDDLQQEVRALREAQ